MEKNMDNLSFLLPTPKNVVRGDGYVAADGFVVNGSAYDDCVYKSAVERLENAVLFLDDNSKKLPVTLSIANVCGSKADSYVLDVNSESAAITANDMGGLYYGAITLTKLFDGKRIPLCHIEDWPDFAYRAQMIDVARLYYPLDELKKLVDVLERCKMNVLVCI